MKKRSTNTPHKKQTKGLSELNKRTYEASSHNANKRRVSQDNFAAGYQYNNSPRTNNTYSRQSQNSSQYQQRPNSKQAGNYQNNRQLNYGRENYLNQQANTGYKPGNNANPYRSNPAQQRNMQNNGASQRPYSSYNRGVPPNGRIPQQEGQEYNSSKKGFQENPEGYNRSNPNSKYAIQSKKRKRNKKIKIILIIAGALILLLTAGFVAYGAFISGNLHQGMDDIGTVHTSLNKPFYMLLMGVDSSEARKSENGSTDNNFRSDSIILARIDPEQKKASLVSLHRDVEVDMGDGYGTQKLNAAHSIGGPQKCVEVVSKLAGVDINYYAEANFEGFAAAIDNVGGVEVNVPVEINDPEAGGYVPAGQQTLNGQQALIFCRSRHTYDNYGDGDKYRAANQRVVLSALAKKILSSDPVTIAKTIADLSNYVKTDLNLNDITGLAQNMKGMDVTNDIYTAMMPTKGVYKNGGWYEELDETKWKEMIKRMDQGLPPVEETVVDDSTGVVLSNSGSGSGNSNSEAKMSGTVAVRNGTTTEGLAAKAAEKLTSLGFKTDTKNANSTDYTETVIVYTNDSQKATAEAIKNELGCGKVIKNSGDYLYDTDYLVVVGSDYK